MRDRSDNEQLYYDKTLTPKGRKELKNLSASTIKILMNYLESSKNNIVDFTKICRLDVAVKLGVCEKTVRRANKELVDKEWLSKTQLSKVVVINPLMALNGNIRRIYRNMKIVEIGRGNNLPF